MGTYLGTIIIRNKHVNFKPLYEFVNNEFYFLKQSDREALLPESSFGDINFYCEDYKVHVDDMFVSDTYCLLEFNTEDLEPNYSNGVRNPTGYKIEVSHLQSGKLKSLSDEHWYYVLDEDYIEGNYKTNPTVVVTDSYAYEGLEVVIPIKDQLNTVIGPFKVEWREQDGNYIIKTGLLSNKYILHGYHFKRPLRECISQIGRYGEEQGFIFIGDWLCEKADIDVITKEQLLSSFRSTLKQENFIDGKVDLSDIGKLIDTYAESCFIGDEIPEEIQRARFETISTILTDEENLNETFGFISVTITGLLDKYQDSDQYQEMVHGLADDPDFMSKIQRFQIITDRIDAKQREFDELTARAAELQGQLADEKQHEYATNLSGEYEEQIRELQAQKDKLSLEISDLEEELGIDGSIAERQKKLDDLEESVSYKEKREGELNSKIATLSNKIDSIFSNSTEKAMSFAFDGMLANRMLQQAAEWEYQQQDKDYSKKILDLKQLELALPVDNELVDLIIERIQQYRPSYDKNTILNILICYVQGFLTVFSGEPGSGKTSICKILANVLGLTLPDQKFNKYSDGASVSRFVPVSVERGWTTKRDFIGYYNPLSKTFDRSNRKIFDALNILDLEARGNSTDMPFMVLLDEANLSPMEYYWADFMNVCDGIDCTSNINLGDNFSFNIPDSLHFVATINNDHTTEALSPRLVDRAWVIKLPKAKYGTMRPVCFNTAQEEIIAWSALKTTFGVNDETFVQMTGTAKEVYDELLNKCKAAKINVSARVDGAIRRYWSVAQNLFDDDINYGTDATIVALDYAIAQRILPHIDGSGEKYGNTLKELQKFCSSKNLSISSELLTDIIKNGEESMQYFQFFA